MTEEKKRSKLSNWLRGIGLVGFLFFLGKGLIWVAIFAGLMKSCG